MTQPITESYIKKHLDGSFFKYNAIDGSFSRKAVSSDYIPDHESASEKAMAWGRLSWQNPETRGRYKGFPEPTEALKQEALRLYRCGLSCAKVHAAMRLNGYKISERQIRELVKSQ